MNLDARSDVKLESAFRPFEFFSFSVSGPRRGRCEKGRFLDVFRGLGKGSTIYSSTFFEVLQKLTIEKARFLGENSIFGSGTVPSFSRFIDAADDGRVEKKPFLRRFSRRGEFLHNALSRISGVFWGSKNALRSEASFSRRKRGFFSRVFAEVQVQLFVMII
jgi:hypothetical protein